MNSRSKLLVFVSGLMLLGILGLILMFGSGGPQAGLGPDQASDSSGAERSADVGSSADASAEGPEQDERLVVAADEIGPPTAVRGVVLDALTLQPLPGVEVAAMTRPPTLERLMSRFRTAFFSGEGLWTSTSRPAEVLARTTTSGDGSFELAGLEPGIVFLDARSDFTFVRSPLQLRIARGESIDGVELLGSPGGRIRGAVRDEQGVPLAGVLISVRPGLNAFLGQMTQQRYRWLEASTDAAGEYDVAGVPAGAGYTISAAGPEMALEERHGIEVFAGQVRQVDLIGHPGARVSGVVLTPDGEPAVGANLAMVYLDVSRVLFSADGRTEPIETASDGSFVVERVAAGRIGFIAATDGLAPSAVIDMTVVDGGVYDGIELRLGHGRLVTGLVVDDRELPVPNARIDLRPMERPNDPDVLKMVLQVRNVVAHSGPDGRFEAAGIDAEQLFLQVSKPGYVTELKFRAEAGEEQKVVLTRGAVVRGQVLSAAGEPLRRFSIQTRSQRIDPETGEPEPRRRGGGRGGPFGGGGGQGGMRLEAGQRIEDRGMGDGWKEFASVDGRFEIDGLPPGQITVRARAAGYRDSERIEQRLAPGEEGEELRLELEAGAVARGMVVEAGSGRPVPDAKVTAYRDRSEDDEGERGGWFRSNMQMEDFDLLGMAELGRRTVRTDSSGKFEISGLAGGRYQFTARHADKAKASAKAVELAASAPTTDILIELDAGGGVEGRVTGAGRLPLADAMVIATSLQAGSMKSSTTDEGGNYRIGGLPPGLYIVFKSRIDERATNIGYDLMGNMRLKTVTVRRDRFTKLDIHDESEAGVRVWGVVRDGGEVVPRAMVTAIGSDSDGLFGMGLRAQPTDTEGRFELAGLEPGEYLFQVTRFAGRPQQANLSVDIPEDVREFRVDLDLPQGYVAGRVIDSQGQPVARIRITAGLQDGGLSDAPGLLGMMMKNRVAETRSDENGEFKLDRMAVGSYRVVASGRRTGRRGSDEWGERAIEDVQVDPAVPVEGLEIVLPRAGRITGIVSDASGNPVQGAEVVAVREDGESGPDAGEQIMDLFGMQQRPVRSDGEGRFELRGVSPGTYSVRADADGLSPGSAQGVVVVEEGLVDLKIQIVQGATLRLRARNVDGSTIPLARISVLDGSGQPLASSVSVASVLKRLMKRDQKVADSGWYEVGNVSPDTYTIVIREPGQPEIRVSREIRDGEEIEWDIDVTAELEAAGRGAK